MPFLIFFHSMRGLFVEMDSIKQVSSMAAEGERTARTRVSNQRGEKSYFGINRLVQSSSNLRSNSFAHTILSVVRRITPRDDGM